MQLIAFIIESAGIVRLLAHVGEPSLAPRRAPIRGPPWGGETWGDHDVNACRSLALDPPVDALPDDESQRQDLSW